MSRNELIAWLDSVRHLYPGGIPRMMKQVSGTVDLPKHRTRVKVLFVVRDADGFSVEEKQLVESAASKGMKLASHEYAVELFGVGLEAACAGVSPAVILVLQGGDRGWSQLGEVPVFSTFSPAQILADTATKRMFWADLQEVMARIEGNR